MREIIFKRAEMHELSGDAWDLAGLQQRWTSKATEYVRVHTDISQTCTEFTEFSLVNYCGMSHQHRAFNTQLISVCRDCWPCIDII